VIIDPIKVVQTLRQRSPAGLYGKSQMICVSLLLAVTVVFEPLEAQEGLSTAEEIAAFIDPVVISAMKDSQIPGAVVVVTRGNMVFYKKGYAAFFETPYPGPCSNALLAKQRGRA